MGNRVLYHGIISAMQQFIRETVEWSLMLADRVQLVVHKLIHYQYGTIGNISWPVIYMLHQCAYHFLGASNFFQVAMRLGKELTQPLFATDSTCKIQFVKNGKLFFRVKDRNVIE